jgi:hypothetical protein
MKKKRVIIFVAIILLFAILAFYFIYSSHGQGSFSKTSLLRMTIPLGGEYKTTVKIFNYEKTKQEFNLYFNNFQGLAELEETKFELAPGESKIVNIKFEDKRNKPGIYVGKLIIKTALKEGEIPIILGVEDANSAFAIIHSSIPKYDNVYPGGKLGVEIKVYDLIGSTTQTVNAIYLIKNFNDDVLFTGEDNLIVGGGSKTALISIPDDWKKEDYILITQINYRNTSSFGSYLFTISSKDEGISGNFNVFIIILIILVLLIFGTVFYFIKTRDDLLIQLKKQQYSEFDRNIKFLKNSKTEIQKSEKKPEKRKIKLRAIEKIKKNILKKLKEKQKKQKKEIGELRKNKKKPEAIKKKMESWKNQGYKMLEADEEIKSTSNREMREQLGNWKKKGYDVSFLNK